MNITRPPLPPETTTAVELQGIIDGLEAGLAELRKSFDSYDAIANDNKLTPDRRATAQQTRAVNQEEIQWVSRNRLPALRAMLVRAREREHHGQLERLQGEAQTQQRIIDDCEAAIAESQRRAAAELEPLERTAAAARAALASVESQIEALAAQRA